MKSDVLKSLAQRAKDRMRAGYISTEGKVCTKKSLTILPKRSAKISVLETDDEKVYKKLCTILEENGDVQNPIKQLMDESTYNKLDESGKERYFFQVVEKYNRLKERYRNENIDKLAR